MMRFQLFFILLLLSFSLSNCKSSQKAVPEEKKAVAKKQLNKPKSIQQTQPLVAPTEIKAIKLDINKEQERNRTRKLNQNKETMESYADNLFFLLERTSCYGRCPTYLVQIFTDGNVTYTGKQWVDNVGTYSFKLSAEELKDIEQRLVQLNYFKLNDLYETPITDFPTVINYASFNGQKKRIIDESTAPKELKKLNIFIDALIATKKWTKIESK